MREGNVTREPLADGPHGVILNFNRDVSLAAGTQVITGVGFKPSAIWCQAAVLNTNPRYSHGYGAYDVDLTTVKSVHLANIYNDTWDVSGQLIGYYIVGAPLTRTYATLTSFDSDGFTLTWNKNGSPTGTLSCYFLAFP